ncbi:MAG: universal stress protein [Dehalococcoidia bacterium]|nr:universal stress protein [Dehalococcoidia bacterium]
MAASSEQVFVVPLSTTPATLHALAVAGEAARHRRATILATYVVEVSREYPVDADLDMESRRGELVLRKAEQIATEGNFSIEADLLQARSAGRAILDEATRRGARVIVIGVPAADYGSLNLGRTAEYLLRKAPCEVWLIREEGAPR